MIDPEMIQALAERGRADSVDIVMQCVLSLTKRFDISPQLRSAIIDEMCRLLLTTISRTFDAIQEVFDLAEKSQ